MTPSSDAMLALRNLEAIIIRCDQGDKQSDWLPIISRLAKDAHASLRAAAQASAVREALLVKEIERLRSALKPFADVLISDDVNQEMPKVRDFMAARAAISPGTSGQGEGK